MLSLAPHKERAPSNSDSRKSTPCKERSSSKGKVSPSSKVKGSADGKAKGTAPHKERAKSASSSASLPSPSKRERSKEKGGRSPQKGKLAQDSRGGTPRPHQDSHPAKEQKSGRDQPGGHSSARSHSSSLRSPVKKSRDAKPKEKRNSPAPSLSTPSKRRKTSTPDRSSPPLPGLGAHAMSSEEEELDYPPTSPSSRLEETFRTAMHDTSSEHVRATVAAAVEEVDEPPEPEESKSTFRRVIENIRAKCDLPTPPHKESSSTLSGIEKQLGATSKKTVPCTLPISDLAQSCLRKMEDQVA